MKRKITGIFLSLATTLAPFAVGADAFAAGRENEPYPHGRFQGECATCHGPEAWNPARFSPKFDHADFGFPLEGAHDDLSCRSCHGTLDFTDEDHSCVECHQDVHDGEFGSDCARCHSPRGFHDRSFFARAHEMTRFPLTGAHATADCGACHAGTALEQPTYVHTPTECASCHRDDYEGTTSPAHVGAGFPQDCTTCHDMDGWPGAAFDHSFFPLENGHTGPSCSSCHVNGVYEGTSSDCYACHSVDYEGTTDPPHSHGYPTDCAGCHETVAWEGAVFVHDAFALTGGHAGAACASCHGDGVFAGKPGDCASCHRDEFAATTNPPHADAGFGEDCASCHNTAGWNAGVAFEHDFFPLAGVHSGLACVTCHTDGPFENASSDCYSCHQADYEGVRSPNHVAGGFSHDCTECHDPGGWPGAVLDHSFFPLTAGHGGVACATCHSDGVYAGRPTDCLSCHQADYEGATEPNHADAGLPTDCAMCHGITTWGEGEFDHDFFALTGGHASVECASCHEGAVFAGTPAACAECHTDDYEATDDPHHALAGIGTDCSGCHDSNGWPGASFEHSFFALTGGHDELDCSSCHGGGVFAGTPAECAECHQPDYAATTNPHHSLAGIGTDCSGCHDIGGWPGATFDHAFFALAGGHNGLSCNACHGDGVFEGKPSDCVECHLADYQGTTDPNHVNAGFPTDCASCHDINGWDGATFDHDGDYFPIYSGKHRGKWDTCSDCHYQQSDYGVFSCLGCHPHNDRNETDHDHNGVNGYSYDSYACYGCHPDGRD